MKNIIFERFIKPLNEEKGHFVGVEIELPIVNLRKGPVSFDLVHRMTEQFVSDRQFSKIQRDEDGWIYLAEHAETGDTLSFDCSYNTLEFSFGRSEDIHSVADRFYSYIDSVQAYFLPEEHTLTGMGINPAYRFNQSEPVANGRYRMLYDYLRSYSEYDDSTVPFHHFPSYGMFTAASQVQLDVTKDNVLEAINTFNRLEPLKALLFANSVWDQNPDILINRDWLWVNSLHGINPHNVGLLRDELRTIDDLVNYISSMSMYCTERDGHYLYFRPMSVKQYFEQTKVTGYWHDQNGKHSLVFTPQTSDIAYLRSFKYVDLTFRGTLELRSVCTQPIAESFASAAFHAGLMEMLPELTQLLQDADIYRQGLTPYVMRELLGRQSIPAFLDKKEVSELLIRILDLSRKGLYQRGFKEAHFLDPLYHRARGLTNPAKEMAGRNPEPFVLAYANTQLMIPKNIREEFLGGSGIGLEEECLRVRPDGYIADTPHPFDEQGAIDRDFCEAQVEIVTPVRNTAENLYDTIKRYRREVVEKIWRNDDKCELLWPFSNPPYLTQENEIPIAQFFGEDRWKTRYRTYLANKYGRQKMLLSGIHFNFSYPDYYLQTAFEKDTETNYSDFVNRRYLELAEKCACYSWLIVALTAASPVQDGSYWAADQTGRPGIDGYGSLRCSEHGYWNDFIPVFDYSSIESYIDSINAYVKSGQLKEERELYYPIRLKSPGRFKMEELLEHGVSHIELRMIDLNPLYETAVALEDLRFLILLLTWLEWKPAIHADDVLQKAFVNNMIHASHMPLENERIIDLDGREVPLTEAANLILDEMEALLGKDPAIDFQRKKINHSEMRYAERVKKSFGDDFVRKGLAYVKEQTKNQMLLAEMESSFGINI